MSSVRRALPLSDRTELCALLHCELIAAVARCPVETARRYIHTWLDVVGLIAATGHPVVADSFVIGLPEPVLLEIAHELRLVRQAEDDGAFADDEELWFEEHDDGEPWEPLRPSDRVAATLADRHGFKAVATDSVIQRLVARTTRTQRHEVADVITVSMSVDRLVAEIADTARIGDAVIVDARLPDERRRRWEWAA